MAAFGAVAHEELLGCTEGCGEGDLAALASSFHDYGRWSIKVADAMVDV